jgi:microcystin-dependent protein
MDPIIGSVVFFGGTFAPSGFAECNGDLLPISQYTALYSILGMKYGGDGSTTFALPTIAPLGNGVRALIAVQGVYPSRP